MVYDYDVPVAWPPISRMPAGSWLDDYDEDDEYDEYDEYDDDEDEYAVRRDKVRKRHHREDDEDEYTV